MRFIARMRNKLESETNRQTIGVAGSAACALAKKHQTSCAADPARLARRNRPEHTAGVIAAGNITRMEPEFVRVSDLGALVGIKRGLTYRKINDGTFKSITLREPGNKFGIRLVYWPGVKNWLHALLEEQNTPENQPLG